MHVSAIHDRRFPAVNSCTMCNSRAEGAIHRGCKKLRFLQPLFLSVIDRQPALKAFANRSEIAFLMIAKTSFRRLKNALNALGDPGEPEAEGA